MGTFAYNLGIPAANDNPSDDQPLMQNNNDAVNDLIAIDHRTFNDVDVLGGYHTDVHQVPLGSYNVFSDGPVPPSPPVPLNIPGINQLFTLNVTPNTTSAPADTQLFSLSGGNGLSQMTGNFSTIEGYQWLGGILLQWGFVALNTSVNAQSNTVEFQDRNGMPSTIPFPNNLFAVYPTLVRLSALPSHAGTVSIRTNASYDKTEFNWTFVSEGSGSNSSNYTGFFWLAIGN